MKGEFQKLRDRLTLIERENKQLRSLFENGRLYPSEKKDQMRESGVTTPNVFQSKEFAYNYETSTLNDRRKVPTETIGASIEARGGAARSLKVNEGITNTAAI